MTRDTAPLSMLSGWGRYPYCQSQIIQPANQQQLLQLNQSFAGIPRGQGRSYGDSALAGTVLSCKYLDQFIEFDPEHGILTVQAGITLAQILEVIVPQGWFLPVTPGTQFVTVAGAIAADVHGKNHHLAGCFSQHLLSMEMLLGDGSQLRVSPTHNTDLFQATCGGMGLTGIILSATLQLLPIKSSQINQTSVKARSLSDVYALFEQAAESTYSVAWIDCLAKGQQLGRSLLMTGEHAKQGPLANLPQKTLSIPFATPSALLNRFSIKAFNSVYYHRQRKTVAQQAIHYAPFFYPLDRIQHWNRLYGRKGFVQYQFVLPHAAGLLGMEAILKRISDQQQGSFLAVLKQLGPANENLLSFPREGYTLALDFKLQHGLFRFLEQLDQLVLDWGGRIYLAKDARMSQTVFKTSYPNWETFEAVRAQYAATGKYRSTQSVRLGLA
ncbi:FAD-binding oxidoreductase [Neptuniibacter sp. CAU 1671]|uniref:FAD-binding oxidoreductase n=1 Tax=Neptuniibacter sp. CAU 1671 TaxID=3032593 RepID=UPI0023DA1C61|nr:FAD-binding oxidoreductase [Neptuniibacter sp. CAU 1671]MDF2182986.1 FAD-binding oxidoreductase [Neptuniibacter sp. CAU 1671]